MTGHNYSNTYKKYTKLMYSMNLQKKITDNFFSSTSCNVIRKRFLNIWSPLIDFLRPLVELPKKKYFFVCTTKLLLNY